MATGPPRPARRDVSIEALARPVDVDHRISIPYYFRIADNLLIQANVYREEKNILDLYIILLRYSSLLCETIPKHRDYNAFKSREKELLKKGPHNSNKLLSVVNELESLKPVVQQEIANLNSSAGAEEPNGVHGTYAASSGMEQHIPSPYTSKSLSGSPTGLLQKSFSGLKHQAALSHSVQPDWHLQKPYSSLPYPKEETLSRHSILGPNGLHGEWTRPVTGIRIEYPSNPELTQSDISSLVPAILNQDGLHGPRTASQDKNDDMQSVLLLDDGRWSLPVEEPASVSPGLEAEFSQLNIRQPSPPPVLAQVHPERGPIPPSRVADPRPGLATSDAGRYKNLHVPVTLMECFLRVAEANTSKNLETCGILAGTLKKRTFYVTTLIIPKQKSTSDSCQATNEEEIFEVQEKGSLLSLGWIHTHPTQTCFLSSVDLHNHYAYQVMLPEAIAIVMAPTDTTRKHGIFHLTDPCGMGVIHACQETGFHPHEEPLDGMPIYEHCSHVYMNPNVKFEMVDLRV
ncbi:AMSH-like ubiquitin thioesterase 3 [Phragmites australis]|uniref:AMSH-like ubiquitin thioesterase 3 n=1 Tax=Phragmites australis TaxID=29695 RepID=UPI002D7A0177|nr:AMSH-like ubiquitin thioesterase 3 [Phragmites australis]